MKLEYYKKGQGTISRMVTWGALTLMALFGAVSLYHADEILPKLGQDGQATWWGKTLFSVPFFENPITHGMLISAAVFILGVFLIYILVINKTSTADFLIETEAELRKVSWPSRHEHIGSTVAVIISVIFIGVFLFFTDNILLQFMKLIGLH
ncbi:MAG: preprotein translocase subunit SecE [Planctomycetes bacterium]|nr:preprotein translocase subunit SecE [Planctomycetota bacterium]